MDKLEVFPDPPILKDGIISSEFLRLGADTFIAACQYVYKLPYGYNSNRDDLQILFKEGMGTCTTKHAVIATLAQELKLGIPLKNYVTITDLSIEKNKDFNIKKEDILTVKDAVRSTIVPQATELASADSVSGSCC